MVLCYSDVVNRRGTFVFTGRRSIVSSDYHPTAKEAPALQAQREPRGKEPVVQNAHGRVVKGATSQVFVDQDYMKKILLPEY